MTDSTPTRRPMNHTKPTTADFRILREPVAFDPAGVVAPMLRRMYEAWRDAAAGRAMPASGELPPAALAWAAEFLSIHDVLADGTFRFRVDAPKTAHLFGDDMSGRLLADYPDPKIREVIRRTLQSVVDTRAPVREMRDITVSLWRWEYEILLVPLAGSCGQVETIYSLPQIGSEIRR
jgi:hypothetical protein